MFQKLRKIINQQKAYIASFDYFDKSLIILSAASGNISIALFAIVIGAPVRIASASFSLIFSVSIEIMKNC